MELPVLPTALDSVIVQFNQSDSQADLQKKAQPYVEYETKLRQIFAQYPDHSATDVDHLVPVFRGDRLVTKARNLTLESEADQDKFLLALSDVKRRSDGTPATVTTLKDFKTNFHLFSEQSLVDLDWSNVVAAGSSVVTSLLPVSKPHNESKRSLRAYYHEQLAPASDVDLFIYGLDEEQALQKIQQIENSVRDSILSETTTIRTKNAITIVSEYPTRHVQIVLRLYKSITEILTGFDVDCSCVAYDGKEVWASPRALAAFATQCNSIDLTRRSPSYENRLSKYSHRGFEVFWPELDRSRVDPTIYERAFNRVVGLARLLVLEKLPHPSDRDTYAEKRRRERGRPELPWNARYRHALPGNVKDAQPDDVPDWLENDHHSDYHTFTIPYGPRYNAKRIEKLLFKQDLLLNAEWNKPKDRKTNLHRHPAFFGTVKDVIEDCCGFCPKPSTDEDLKAQEEESKLYISGKIEFMKDNPGRQSIGSFNPLTTADWTDMAYVGSVARLCQAIIDNDLESMKEWFNEEGANVNSRDHTGRTPLHLACLCSSIDAVQILVDHGARIVARIYNGMTALHIAAHRGQTDIVNFLLEKSEANREEEERKEETRKQARRAATQPSTEDMEANSGDNDDIDMVDASDESDEDDDHMTEGSFIKVQGDQNEEDAEDEPDVYDVDVLAWDNPVSPLHLAIIGGHIDTVSSLINKFGADVMLPVVQTGNVYGRPQAILNLVLPLQLSSQKANGMIRALLANGASPAQADSNQISNVHYIVHEMKIEVLDILNEANNQDMPKLLNHIVVEGWHTNPSIHTPLLTAIRTGSPNTVRKVLQLGAEMTVSFESFARAYAQKFDSGEKNPDKLKELYLTCCEQPIIALARHQQMYEVLDQLVTDGVEVNTLDMGAHGRILGTRTWQDANSLLDLVRDQVKQLKSFLEDKGHGAKVKDLPVSRLSAEDSYQSWILQTNYQQAEEIHAEYVRHQDNIIKHHGRHNCCGEAEKEEVVKSTMNAWGALEAKMLDKGAKTYAELSHDQKPNNHRWHFNTTNRTTNSGHNKDKAFENKLSFQVPDLNEVKKEQYISLFEAVYAGNTAAVRTLCLANDNPLQVAVQDMANFSPFSLAVLRGHYDLARTIMEIAAAQYEPPKQDQRKYRYSLRHFDDATEDSEYDSEADEDTDDKTFRVYKELVDEEYTINDIRQLSGAVKSKVSPATLLDWTCELWRTMSYNPTEAKKVFKPKEPWRAVNPLYKDEYSDWFWFNEMLGREGPRNNFGLFRYAIVGNDMTMLKFLLNMRKALLYDTDNDDSLQHIQLDLGDVDLALRLGRTDMISEIVRTTGTLLPLANLAERSGVEPDDRSQYYQGLSVYGQKRKDWAQENRARNTRSKTYDGSPLLTALLSGNIRSVEYFMSDTPLRCYEEFVAAFGSNKHLKLLAKAEGGIDRALHSWMDTRTHLAIHMAIMAPRAISEPVRGFAIKRMSQYIDAKSLAGITPLMLAIQNENNEAAKQLIEAGADQTTRDKSGRNLLHVIYSNLMKHQEIKSVEEYVAMLESGLIPVLALQRSHTEGAEAHTPLMAFLNSRCLTKPAEMAVLDSMLDLSHEKDLEVMDGSGDFPLHSLVRKGDGYVDVVQHIVQRRPDLLFKENGTGMTPIQIADEAFLRGRLQSQLSLIGNYGHYQTNVTAMGAREFLTPYQLEPRDRVYPFQKVHHTLHNLASRYSEPRTLVSLLDANETARRLAEQQKKNNEEQKLREAKGLLSYRSVRTYYNNADNEQQDEVETWTARANNMAHFATTDVPFASGTKPART